MIPGGSGMIFLDVRLNRGKNKQMEIRNALAEYFLTEVGSVQWLWSQT